MTRKLTPAEKVLFDGSQSALLLIFIMCPDLRSAATVATAMMIEMIRVITVTATAMIPPGLVAPLMTTVGAPRLSQLA